MKFCFPRSFSTSDHKVALVEFNVRHVARHRVRICHLEMRRLICEKKSVVDKYKKKSLELLQFYNIGDTLDELEKWWDSLEKLKRTIKLDLTCKKVDGLLLNAEKHHRKLLTGEVYFSP